LSIWPSQGCHNCDKGWQIHKQGAVHS